MTASSPLDRMVEDLVPSLSRSLAERFNVFRVMHHGTHEKQLSNVFAWLLRSDATHDLGDAFQRIFVSRVRQQPVPSAADLPLDDYRVTQEVDTAGRDAPGRDIADIVLSRPDASIVVENFESSDGHGHDYEHYLTHGQTGERRCVVVLLCARREPHRQTDGWQDAAVITYAELLEDLERLIGADSGWRRTHAEQHFFIRQLVEHFVEGSSAVSTEDRLSFIKAMCETGESARYGYRPQEAAAQEFANLLAQHARKQFEDGRALLSQTKRALRTYAERTLMGQLNEVLEEGRVSGVHARFVGQWEWCVTFERESAHRVFLEFGPTAVVENGRTPVPLLRPDYTRVFATRLAPGGKTINRIIQTGVGLDEVFAGLRPDDTRLRDALVSVAR